MATWAIAGRQAAVNALAALCNGGTIKFYSAADALLASCTFGATAFGGANASAVTVAAAVTDSGAASAGTISYGKLWKSDGTTQVGQLTCTVTGGGGDFEFNALALAAGDIVRVTGLSLTQAA